MAFGSLDGDDASQPMAEINMVPMIDVSMVLLVIFIITAPLLTHAVKVDLPKASSSPNLTKPENVQLAIDAAGLVYWNGETVSPEQLGERMAAAAVIDPQPELHIRAERTTPYEKVAQVMSEAARRGLLKIGFITDPGGDATPSSAPAATPPTERVQHFEHQHHHQPIDPATTPTTEPRPAGFPPPTP